MKTEWSIPKPPDESVEDVVDDSGREYRRIDDGGEYWYSEALGNGRGTYAWVDLLVQRGPVRLP